jgi:SAM-dependent MidA family methyltransferase
MSCTPKLVEKIGGEIRTQGVISFARFMELALYCPDCGYYEKEKDTLGRAGDYYTSVSVGSLFGELLARQFADWADDLDAGEGFSVVEAGAHDGQLAVDILAWLERRRPDLVARLTYWLVEPSPRRLAWQREKVARFGDRVRWTASLGVFAEQGAASPVNGVIFCNELLDAMPVHRWGWDAARQSWFEWGVGLANGAFVWERMPELRTRPNELDAVEQAGEPAGVPEELRAVLPDGFVLETCPAAAAWWRDAARALRRGKLMALDYGFAGPERFTPERPTGSLRAYFQHQVSEDLLSQPGMQDLTAHVDFTLIRELGEREGLRTERLVTQGQFLTEVLERAIRGQTDADAWDGKRARAFHTLTHPEHLGRSFRVLVQAR